MQNIYKLSFLILFAGVFCLSLGTAVLAQSAPQIQTNSATNIQNSSATLNANLTYLGSYGSTTVYFQWGTTTSYGYQTPNMTQNYAGSFSQTIFGLSPNNTYHFRAVAQNSYGTVYGQDMTLYANQSNGGTLTVNAGPDLYLTSNQTSTLQGSGYDPNGYSLNYYWTCNGGTLSSYNIAQPVYTAPYTNNYNNQTTYTCTLTVTNSYGGSNSDSMIVYINGNNNNNNGNCTYHSYERCVGNGLYWYDSCGTQQDLAQYCSNGCSGNSCGYNNNNNNNNNYNNNNCTYHAYKLCVGSNIYWYDSCGTQQDLYYSCVNGQTCNNPGQYGQCGVYIQPVQPPVQPINNYVAHYKTACYSNSLYWYDSLGAVSGLYKNCVDNNSCTLDACSSGKCSNTIKCDGSTCAAGSADYTTYCQAATPATTPAPTPTAPTNCGNGLCETTLGETNANCPADCKITAASGLSVSFFTKQDAGSAQWQKTAQVGPNSQIYFMISAANTSTIQIDNVSILANIPTEIYSLGNLQLNGIPVSGDIVSGVNIGSLAPSSAKSITFEGKTQILLLSKTEQATATSNVSGATQSDSVSINLVPGQTAASVSVTPATSGFMEFLKHWYLWILVAVVLIFLFVIVFKRLSSDE